MGTRGIKAGMRGIRVGMQGMGVGMLGMRGMRGIKVGMRGIRVILCENLRVHCLGDKIPEREGSISPSRFYGQLPNY